MSLHNTGGLGVVILCRLRKFLRVPKESTTAILQQTSRALCAEHERSGVSEEEYPWKWAGVPLRSISTRCQSGLLTGLDQSCTALQQLRPRTPTPLLHPHLHNARLWRYLAPCVDEKNCTAIDSNSKTPIKLPLYCGSTPQQRQQQCRYNV